MITKLFTDLANAILATMWMHAMILMEDFDEKMHKKKKKRGDSEENGGEMIHLLKKGQKIGMF